MPLSDDEDIFFADSLDLKVTTDTLNAFATYGVTDRLSKLEDVGHVTSCRKSRWTGRPRGHSISDPAGAPGQTKGTASGAAATGSRRMEPPEGRRDRVDGFATPERNVIFDINDLDERFPPYGNGTSGALA